MSLLLGQCGLCFQTEPLQESHFMPSALYKICREPEKTNPNPVIVRPTGSISTSAQVTSHFLCETCEDRFSRSGEQYVLGNCARQDGAFALRDELRGVEPLSACEDFVAFDLSRVAAINTEKLAYFGSSIFWRSSAGTWKDKAGKLKTISLGPYEEEFRRYLVGETAFPSEATMLLKISDELKPDVAISFPTTYKDGSVFRHKFLIPGLMFILYVGRTQPNGIRSASITGEEPHTTFLCKIRDDNLFSGFLKLVGDAKATKEQRTRQRRNRRQLTPRARHTAQLPTRTR